MDKETQAFISHEMEKLAQITEKGMHSMIKFFLLAILASLIFKALHTREVPL
jgi:hypothetical protein